MQGWFTPETLIGLSIALVFAMVARTDLRRGVLVYAILGAEQYLRIGALSGREIVQSLNLAEVLGTVLILLWLMQRQPRRSEIGSGAPLPAFSNCLLWLVPVSALSLLASQVWYDPRIPMDHVKLSVSLGQILLFVWPIGIYLVAADVVRNPAWGITFERAMVALTLPVIAGLLQPSVRPWFGWSNHFMMIASPMCFARLFYDQRIGRRLFLLAITLLPLILGFRQGKFFMYGYVLVAVGAILWAKARSVFVVVLPLACMAYVGMQLASDAVWLPEPVEELVQTEIEQKSWEGDAGRVALATDAIRISSRFPLLGVGPGNSYPYMVRYSVVGTPHSQYFNLLLELGLPGLLLFVGFVIGAIRFGLAELQRATDPARERFLLAWFGGFVGLSVVSITGDYMLHSIRNGGLELFSGFFLHWIWLGAAVGLTRAETPVVDPATALNPVSWQSEGGPGLAASGRPV